MIGYELYICTDDGLGDTSTSFVFIAGNKTQLFKKF